MIKINDFVQITFIICATIIISQIIDCKYGKKTVYKKEIHGVKDDSRLDKVFERKKEDE